MQSWLGLERSFVSNDSKKPPAKHLPLRAKQPVFRLGTWHSESNSVSDHAPVYTVGPGGGFQAGWATAAWRCQNLTEQFSQSVLCLERI